jgi:small subunit ribosomal protein S8
MDSISNLLTSIRNAEMASHQELTVPSSKLSLAVLTVLKRKQYIEDFAVEKATPQDSVKITLTGSIHHYKRISKPGRRMYSEAKDIPTVLQGQGIVIISTSGGVMPGYEAKKKKLGGELLCEVY